MAGCLRLSGAETPAKLSPKHDTTCKAPYLKFLHGVSAHLAQVAARGCSCGRSSGSCQLTCLHPSIPQTLQSYLSLRCSQHDILPQPDRLFRQARQLLATTAWSAASGNVKRESLMTSHDGVPHGISVLLSAKCLPDSSWNEEVRTETQSACWSLSAGAALPWLPYKSLSAYFSHAAPAADLLLSPYAGRAQPPDSCQTRLTNSYDLCYKL